MTKSRQKTLFQTWSGPKRTDNNSARVPLQNYQEKSDAIQISDDEQDDDLLKALELSLLEAQPAKDGEPTESSSSHARCSTLFSSVGENDHNKRAPEVSEDRKCTMFPRERKNNSNNNGATTRKPSDLGLFKVVRNKQESLVKYIEDNPSKSASNSEEPRVLSEAELLALEDLPGFDKFSGQRWIYPTNYPVRDYQYNIVKSSLYENTLVVLPTGLGKTFVAAVVMYNFYRWYPQGKVIFMAPTKPLVAQQIEACYNVMGIPQDVTAEMTGAMQPAERKREWQNRRVFFLTPQVLLNDLSREACPALFVKCLVVDEAHKALGNHAYCQVVRELAKYEGGFRVLALSATPGSDMKAVQQVINNLLISHVELRGDESPDIKPYTHERRVEKIVVKLGDELNSVRTKYVRLIEMVINRLKRMGVIYNRDVTSLSKFLVLKARDAFRQNPPHNIPRHQYGVLEGDFALAMSLYHGYDLLLLHGLRSLHSFLHGIVNGEKGYGRTRTELMRNKDFTELMDLLQEKYAPVKNADPNMPLTQTASQLAIPFVIGHPKMGRLQDVVIEHFTKFEEKGDKTRIMIFSQYRDSVSEITEMLNRHRPLVKVMSFIGQSSAGKVTKGFTQKEQLRVMHEFRTGGFNTLVSTCVGEEGLDIGDVDLIICYDAHKSPIRLVQRMGRTGRKREGRIVMLVTEGKEESIYNQSQYTKRSIHRAIENSAKSLVFYANNKRMVPTGLHPQCHKMHLTVHQKYKIGANKVSAGRKGPIDRPPPKRTGTRKKAAPDGFLTEDELKCWTANYKMNEREIPCLPASQFVTLKQKNRRETMQNDGNRILSLNAWMPWQNRLQDTINVSHTLRSRILVDLMEFMDVQSALGDDEDVYGQEMQLYLNKADVISRSKSAGIARFCQPLSGSDTSNMKRKRHDKEESKKRLRRSEQLPGFSSDEEEFRESPDDDDDDLPAFDGKCAKTSNRPKDKKHSNQPKMDENEKSVELPCANIGNIVAKGKGKGKGKGCSNRKLIGETGNTNVDAGYSAPDHNDNITKKSRRKKKRSSEYNQSVIPFLGNVDDIDDFEGCVSEAVNTSSALQDYDANNATHRAKDQTLLDYKSYGVIKMETSDIVSKCEHVEEHDETAENDDKPMVNNSQELAISQALPYFSSQNNTLLAETEVDVSTQVANPPTTEELSQSLHHLEKKGRISPVDLLNLIEKWEKEKSENHGNVGSYKPSSPCKCSVAQVKVSIRDLPAQNYPCTENMDEDFSDFPDEAFDEIFFDGTMLTTQSFDDNKNAAENRLTNADDKPLAVGRPTNHQEDRIGSKTAFKKPLSETAVNLNETTEPPRESLKLKNYQSPQRNSGSDSSTKNLSPIFSNCSSMLVQNTSTPLIARRIDLATAEGDFGEVTKPFEQALQEDAGKSMKDRSRVDTSSIQKSFSAYKTMEDSFFANETDDSFFADYQDPGPSKKRSPLLPKVSTVDSVMTFTQALDCVDHSHNASKSFLVNSRSSESDQSPVTNQNPSKERKLLLSSPDTPTETVKFNNTMRGKPSPEIKNATEVQELKSESEENVEFDLGFDLDEFDDEMIIPPSPAKEMPSLSQRSKPSFSSGRLSLSLSFRNDKSRKAIVPTRPQQLSRSPIPEYGSDVKDLIGEGKHELDTCEDRSDATSPPLIDDRIYHVKRPTPLEGERNKASSGRNPLTPVAVVKPCIAGKEIEHEIGDTFADDLGDEFDEDSDDLFRNLDPDIPSVTDKTNDHQDGTTHAIEDVHTSSEEDESFLNLPRRRRKAVPIILSQSTPDKSDMAFKTPTKPAPKTNKQNKVSDFDSVECDSPILPPKKSRRQQRALFEDDSPIPVKRAMTSKRMLTIAADVVCDEDDEFTDFQTTRQKSVQMKKSNPPRGKSTAVGFIDMEAERSEDDCSEDESEGSHLDEMEASFINDHTEMSQSVVVNESDMRAIYRESTRSPTHSGGRFKLMYGHNAHLDVFSQVPEQDSEYMEDSFVVHGDDDLDGFIVDEADEVASIGGEVTLLDSHFDMTMSRQTRRQARIAANRKDSKPVTKNPTAKPRKRVIHRVDSSSEEEMDLPSTQTLMGVGRKQKASDSSTKMSSSSTDHSVSEDESLISRLKGASRVRNSAMTRTEPGSRQIAVPPLNNDVNDSLLSTMPSLQKRCKFRLHTASDIEPKLIHDTHNPPPYVSKESKGKVTCNKIPSTKSNTSKVLENMEEGPNFAIETDLFEEDWNDDLTCELMEQYASPDLKVRASAGASAGSSRAPQLLHKNVSSKQNQPSISPPLLTDRERRLKLAREQKEKFLRESKSFSNTTAVKNIQGKPAFHGSQIHPPPPSPAVSNTSCFNMTNNLATPKNVTAADSSLVSPIASSIKGKLIILVDSKVINGAQDILSALRFKHNVQTAIRQLSSCDYILSNRLAVVRISLSAFSNGANKVKLVDRVREMFELYDRPCLIIERDRLKTGEKRPTRPVPPTKYVNTTMAALARTHVKILFSEDQDHTAKLLSDLAVQEQKKNQAIQANIDLSSEQMQVLSFYLTLPRVSYIAALNLCHQFRTVTDFIKTSESALVKRGYLSQPRVKEIHAYIRRCFDPQMMNLRR